MTNPASTVPADVYVGYRLMPPIDHDRPTANREAELTLARDPGHVFAPVAMSSEGLPRPGFWPRRVASCVRCLTLAPVERVATEDRALVPIPTGCAPDGRYSRAHLVDGDRVVLVLRCPTCHGWHPTAPDGAFLTHRTGPDRVCSESQVEMQAHHLAINAAVAAVRSELDAFLPRAGETMGRLAAKNLLAHAASTAALAVVLGRHTAITVLDPTTGAAATVDVAADGVEGVIVLSLGAVREAVSKIITARVCQDAAERGGWHVAELVDSALALAVRLVLDPTHQPREQA